MDAYTAVSRVIKSVNSSSHDSRIDKAFVLFFRFHPPRIISWTLCASAIAARPNDACCETAEACQKATRRAAAKDPQTQARGRGHRGPFSTSRGAGGASRKPSYYIRGAATVGSDTKWPLVVALQDLDNDPVARSTCRAEGRRYLGSSEDWLGKDTGIPGACA